MSINYTYLSKYFDKYENGETEPGIKVLCKLSSVYNVPYEVIIENRYKDGVPEKRDYAETIDLKKFRASEKCSSSGTCISDAMPAYEYSTQRPAPIIKTLREIQHLVKQLDFSEKMKLAARIDRKDFDWKAENTKDFSNSIIPAIPITDCAEKI